MTYGKAKSCKMQEHRISCKVLKIFSEKVQMMTSGSLEFFYCKVKFASGLLYGKSSWIL